METITVNSVQEAYNLGYKDGFKTAKTNVTQTRYVQERTCKMETGYSGYDSLVCSECGEYTTVYHKGKYCSGCGAKVVE